MRVHIYMCVCVYIYIYIYIYSFPRQEFLGIGTIILGVPPRKKKSLRNIALMQHLIYTVLYCTVQTSWHETTCTTWRNTSPTSCVRVRYELPWLPSWWPTNSRFPYIWVHHAVSFKLVDQHTPSGRAVYGAGLQALACWDCGFESRRCQWCLSVLSVVYCQVQVSATGWSFVQRCPTDCGVSLCVITWIITLYT